MPPPPPSPPPHPSDYQVQDAFPPLQLGPQRPRHRSYASVAASNPASTSAQPAHMPVDEHRSWSAEDIDMPAGLSELSSALLPIRIGGTIPNRAEEDALQQGASEEPTPASGRASVELQRSLSETPRIDSEPSHVSIPELLRRTSAWRSSVSSHSGPLLGMSLPNTVIQSRGRAEDSSEYPWDYAVATAQRAGYFAPESEDTGRRDRPPRERNNRDMEQGDRLERAESSSRTLSRARRTPGPQVDLRRPRGQASIVIPGGRGVISQGPQQVVPTNSHFSWASYGAGTGSSSTRNDRMATTVLRRRMDRDERPAESVRHLDRNTTSQTRVEYGFDPADIAPPGGADDHIWDMLGDADSDDEDDRWGTFRGSEALGALSASGPAGYTAPASQTALYNLLEMDAWGSTPEAGATLSRGRFNRRRRSIRERVDDSARAGSDVEDEPFELELTPRSRARSWAPTNTQSASPVIVRSDTRGTRRRRSSNLSETEDSHDVGKVTPKRRRHEAAELCPDSTRPSYLSFTKLPANAKLPTHFTPPSRASHLHLSTKEIRGKVRPVVTFTQKHGLRLSVEHPDNNASALRASDMVPGGIGVYYFEVEVLEPGEGFLTVGWMTSETSLGRLVGWDPGSLGWHADDGKTFEGRGDGVNFSEPWGVPGDIVGCGLDYTTGRAFFTRNGRHIGNAFTQVPLRLYPAVALRSPEESLAINFTGPFKYDIDAHVKGIRDRVQQALKPKHEAFSDLPLENVVPRLAGLPARGEDKSSGERNLKASEDLPKDSALLRGESRAAAALVLDHLATAGHQKVLSLLTQGMRKRGWLPPAPDAPSSESPAVRIAQVLAALKQGQVLWTELASLCEAGVYAHLERRLRVHEFATSAKASASAAQSGSTGEEAMEIDDDRVLSAGRELRRRARDEKWAARDTQLLDHAAALLAPASGSEPALDAARAADAEELERVLREACGIKPRSCLHMALAQSELVSDVLVKAGDGETAFLGLSDVLRR